MAQLPRRRSRSSGHLHAIDVPHSSPSMLLDAWWRVVQSLARASGHVVSQMQTRPRVETAVKCSGGVVAALLALKYATSVRSACIVGLVSGVFAHSLYADVIRKKPLLELSEEQEEDDAEDTRSDQSVENDSAVDKASDAGSGGTRATR